jgi:hypothetical protein
LRARLPPYASGTPGLMALWIGNKMEGIHPLSAYPGSTVEGATRRRLRSLCGDEVPDVFL